MDRRPKTLKEIAQAASDNNGGARGRQLGRIAEKAGLTLSYTTVDKMLAGTYTSRPGRKTLESLSQLSGVPLAVVYEAAQMELPQARLADQLPPEADTLSPEQRKVIIDLTRLFVRENRHINQLEASLENVEKKDDYRLAARKADNTIGHNQMPEDT